MLINLPCATLCILPEFQVNIQSPVSIKPCLPSTSKIASSLNGKSNLLQDKLKYLKTCSLLYIKKAKKSAATLLKSSKKLKDKTSPEESIVSISPKPPNSKASLNALFLKSKNTVPGLSSNSNNTVPRSSDKPPQKLPKYLQNRFEVLPNNCSDDFVELQYDDDSEMEVSDSPTSDSIHQLDCKNNETLTPRSSATSINAISTPRISETPETKMNVSSRLNKDDRKTLYHIKLAYKYKNKGVCSEKSKEDETVALYTSDIED